MKTPLRAESVNPPVDNGSLPHVNVIQTLVVPVKIDVCDRFAETFYKTSVSVKIDEYKKEQF